MAVKHASLGKEGTQVVLYYADWLCLWLWDCRRRERFDAESKAESQRSCLNRGLDEMTSSCRPGRHLEKGMGLGWRCKQTNKHPVFMYPSVGRMYVQSGN